MSDQPGILQVGEEPSPMGLEGTPSRRKRKPSPPKGKGKKASRFQVINHFADFTLRGLKRNEIAVWLLLWRDTKPPGLARTSQADLGRRAGTSERTARRAVHKLAKAGLLTTVYRGGLQRGPSTYRVHPLAKPL